MEISFELPGLRVFDGWYEVRVLRRVSVHTQVCSERCDSDAFRDYLRSLLSWATGDYTRQRLSSFSALIVNPLGLPSRTSKANGNIKIAHEYIDVVYLLSLL